MILLNFAHLTFDLTPRPPSLQGKGEPDSPPRAGEGPGERSTGEGSS